MSFGGQGHDGGSADRHVWQALSQETDTAGDLPLLLASSAIH